MQRAKWGFILMLHEYIYSPYTAKDLVIYSAIRLGYRHQKKEGGIFYKIGITPLAEVVIDLRLDKAIRYKYDYMEKFAYPWAGAAIGWTLKNKK